MTLREGVTRRVRREGSAWSHRMKSFIDRKVIHDDLQRRRRALNTQTKSSKI